MLSHFDKWMLKTTLPSSNFVERWHKERRNVFCIHYKVLCSERRIKLATLRAIKICWSLLLPAAPGFSAYLAQSCRSWDLAPEGSPTPGISFWGFYREQEGRTCSSDWDLPLTKEKWGNSAELQMSALDFSWVWDRICFSCWGLCVESSSAKPFFLSLGFLLVPWPGAAGPCWTLAAEWGMHRGRVSALRSCLGKTIPRLFFFKHSELHNSSGILKNGINCTVVWEENFSLNPIMCM